jgi:hypothetical protein
MRFQLVVVGLAIAAATQALAAQLGNPADLWNPPADLPRADSGKPAIFTPPPVLPRTTDYCPAGMPCGLRLLGTVQRNGAVEVQVPALRW